MSSPERCRACSQDINHVKSTDNTTAALAEAVRVQSHALLALIERDKQKPHPAILEPPPPNASPRGGMVISEHVGSISVEQWNGMSHDSLRGLDRVLRGMIDTTVHTGGGWSEMALGIRRDLENVGLVFKTLEMCQLIYGDNNWETARNAALPDLVRMRAVVRQATMYSRPEWWATEMMSVVLQLMELRGM